MMSDWPLPAHRYFTFNKTLLEAGGIQQDHGEYWIASRHHAEPSKIEFFNMTDIFAACVFYDTPEEAAKELITPPLINHDSKESA